MPRRFQFKIQVKIDEYYSESKVVHEICYNKLSDRKYVDNSKLSDNKIIMENRNLKRIIINEILETQLRTH